MPPDDGRDIAIVSDLHLCAGYNERTGAFSRREDFFYDGAFARFLAHLRRRADEEGRRWRLVILGDFFDYLQGVLYAEHGHQYDDVNSFPFQLRPFAEDDPGQTDLPLGSYFVSYLFNQIESIDPFADNVRPVTSYLVWALRVHPVRTLSTLGFHLRLLVAVLRRSKDQTPIELQARRDAYRRELLPAYAESVGLDYDAVVAIDRLAATPAMTNKLRQLQAIILGPLVDVAPAIAGAVAIYVG